ncbi:MAG: helix-hairpin-helix domain-containing protein [Schlesneria sp.]
MSSRRSKPDHAESTANVSQDPTPANAGSQTPVVVLNDSSPIAQSVSVKSDVTSNSTTLWLRRADQFFLGVVLILLLVLLIAHRWKLSESGKAEIEITNQQPREYFYSIDINRASWVEWAQLDGIGEKLARRIVEDRNEKGPFRSVEDLKRVRGLGLKLIEKLRPFLKCNEGEHQDAR